MFTKLFVVCCSSVRLSTRIFVQLRIQPDNIISWQMAFVKFFAIHCRRDFPIPTLLPSTVGGISQSRLFHLHLTSVSKYNIIYYTYVQSTTYAGDPAKRNSPLTSLTLTHKMLHFRQIIFFQNKKSKMNHQRTPMGRGFSKVSRCLPNVTLV